MGPQWQQVVAFLDGVMLAAMALVLATIVLLLAVYILAYYQHPDDLTQSWWSKLVAVWSFFLIFFAPVFVAIDFSSVHDTSCRGSTDFQDDIELFLRGDCSAPTRLILYLLIFSDLLLVYAVIPFTMHISWEVQTVPLKLRFPRAVGITLFFAGCWMGAYALLWYFYGYVQVLVWPLESGLVGVGASRELEACVVPEQAADIYRGASGELEGIHVITCDAMQHAPLAERIGYRLSYWEYVIAIHTIVGWVVFSFLGGVGLASYPWTLVSGFLYRQPRPLTKSEYIRRVQAISERARNIRDKTFKARKDAETNGKWETKRMKNQLTRLVSRLGNPRSPLFESCLQVQVIFSICLGKKPQIVNETHGDTILIPRDCASLLTAEKGIACVMGQAKL
uniref:Uncharacterized protein n=1 Tax=Tetraselmis chuii TaxID=63592 RepID=A0A7S1T0F0_9CHLO|mmetsp:Transcript_38155/g.68431  ORF Transcript_38155/g.68431 Transcript_38155/m.68431 type:complete len:393 (+) Transcript_38155:181-1359(+)